jgi:hypothetical protein
MRIESALKNRLNISSNWAIKEKMRNVFIRCTKHALSRTPHPLFPKLTFVNVFPHITTHKKILIFPGSFIFHKSLKTLTGYLTCKALYKDLTVKPLSLNFQVTLSLPSLNTTL